MNELGPEARALIEAARTEAPRASLKHAVKASVVAKATSGAKVATAAVKAATVAKIGSAAAVVAVAGWVALSPNPQPDDAVVADPVVMQQAPAPVDLKAPEAEPEAEAESQVKPVVEQAAVGVADEVEPPPVQRAVTVRAPAADVAPQMTAPPVEVEEQPKLSASSLAAETRLLEGMSEAATEKNWRRVLFLAKAHADQYPAGLLAAERLVLTARAACELDDMDTARAARQTLVDTMPESTFVAAVNAACDF